MPGAPSSVLVNARVVGGWVGEEENGRLFGRKECVKV